MAINGNEFILQMKLQVEVNDLLDGDRVVLPEVRSIGSYKTQAFLSKLNISGNDQAMHRTYCLKKDGGENSSKRIVCGVLEYSAPEGVIQLSRDVCVVYYFMNQVLRNLDVMAGEEVVVEEVQLPKVGSRFIDVIRRLHRLQLEVRMSCNKRKTSNVFSRTV